MNLPIFCRSPCRHRRRCLSPPLLWSKHFAIIVTWHHTSPLYIFSDMSCIVDLKVWQKKTREPYCVYQKICWRIFEQRYPPDYRGIPHFFFPIFWCHFKSLATLLHIGQWIFKIPSSPGQAGCGRNWQISKFRGGIYYFSHRPSQVWYKRKRSFWRYSGLDFRQSHWT